MSNSIEIFLSHWLKSWQTNSFIKLNFSNNRDSGTELKKLIGKRVLIKNEEHLSITYQYQTNDIIKNYLLPEAKELLQQLLSPTNFRQANLFTIEKDYQLKCSKKADWKLIESRASISKTPTKNHDKNKKRIVSAKGKSYLQDLKITDASGAIRPHGQDKFKQINHYIEILSTLLKNLSMNETLHLVDMGSGKGYLTFALYDYLKNNLQLKAHLTGVEYRADLVNLCNSIAKNSKFETLSFVEGSIENFETPKKLDALIALHACDTATDDAIAQGIKANAQLIVVAPCCHKQIRREMKKGQATKEIKAVTKHGIFMERQAEMLTDTLRALYLECAGYKTKVFDFIATEHTPKNILIVAEKRTNPSKNTSELREEINDLKKYFGINEHYLELQLDL
jgi:SAM-dependent methyltransferase